MKVKIINKKPSKSQSILEYLIVMAAIFIAILANTFGLGRGVQNSLDTTQNSVASQMNNPAAPQNVQEQNYYKPAEDQSTSTQWSENTDTYGGSDYTGGYNYDEWVQNNPDSAYNAPAAGTIIQSADVSAEVSQ